MYIDLYLRSATPVVVYQMGKVGSSSISSSLKIFLNRPVFHVHMMSPENTKRFRKDWLSKRTPIPHHIITGEQLYKAIIKRNREAKFITAVREPIARNISAFFQNFGNFIPDAANNHPHSVGELASIFIERYPHTVPLKWFDREIKETLQIDVYNHSFPKEKGYTVLKRGGFELLILKSEIDDNVKRCEIASFLDLSDLHLRQGNVASQKDYAETYRAFVRNVQLPAFYIDAMCEAKFTRHFYTDEEIECMRMRWAT